MADIEVPDDECLWTLDRQDAEKYWKSLSKYYKTSVTPAIVLGRASQRNTDLYICEYTG